MWNRKAKVSEVWVRPQARLMSFMKVDRLLRCLEPQFPHVSISLMNAKLTGFLRRAHQTPQESNQQLVVKTIIMHVCQQGGASLETAVWTFSGKLLSCH